MKIFFSDSGSLGQLRATLERVEAEAGDNVRALGKMAEAPRCSLLARTGVP